MWALQKFMCQERRKENTASTTKNYIYSVSVIQIRFSIFFVTCDRTTQHNRCQIQRDGRSLAWLDRIQAATSGAVRRQRGEQQLK